MPRVFNDRYTCGDGRRGSIFCGIDNITEEEVAIQTDVTYEYLLRTREIYNRLAGGVGIPFLHYCGSQGDCNYVVMNLLGPSLGDLFESCRQQFTLKTVLMLATQLLTRLQFIHQYSGNHGDIRPESFLIGTGESVNQISVINISSTHRNTEYASDDLLSLGYMLLRFLRPLSWEGLDEERKVRESKCRTTIDQLCKDVPAQFSTYFGYVLSLDVHDEVRYPYLQQLFADLFALCGFSDDNVFDWTVRKHQSKDSPVLIGHHERRFQNHSTDTTRAVNLPELVTEVNGISTAIDMVENRIKSLMLHETNLSEDQVRTLITLYKFYHRQILDFFSVIRHPTFPEKQLAEKLQMPARFWSVGVRPMLQALSTRFADSHYMLLFLRHVYLVHTLLLELAPTFKATWIEGLGHLAHYFMETTSSVHGQDVWLHRAKMWYEQVAKEKPNDGRFQFYIGLIANNNNEKLFYYLKSLVSITPYQNARDTLKLHLDGLHAKVTSLDAASTDTPPGSQLSAFIHMLFLRGPNIQSEELAARLLKEYDQTFTRYQQRPATEGSMMAIILIAAIFDFGSNDSILCQARVGEQHVTKSEIYTLDISRGLAEMSLTERLEVHTTTTASLAHAKERLSYIFELLNSCISRAVRQMHDQSAASHVHATLVFLLHLAKEHTQLFRTLEAKVPWKQIVMFASLSTDIEWSRVVSSNFPHLGREMLPEDICLNGLLWTEGHYPGDFFTKESSGTHHSHSYERAIRAERSCWILRLLAEYTPSLSFNGGSMKFSVQADQTDVSHIDGKQGRISLLCQAQVVTAKEPDEAEIIPSSTIIFEASEADENLLGDGQVIPRLEDDEKCKKYLLQ